jgi:hypothetical protein
MAVTINSIATISSAWTGFKTSVDGKVLSVQYDDNGVTYEIFAFDGPLVYTCAIWKGAVPDGVILSGGYSQGQNDSDKSDFETNYKPFANKRIGVSIIEPLQSAVSRAQISGARSGQSNGYMNVSATTPLVIRLSAYTEPTTAVQRSVVSTSANDTSAGTGARKIRITYYDNTMAGPFTEDLTMNGTTPVNTVATNIRFIEEMHVIEAGSLRANDGVINLKSTTGGGGSTIGSISAFGAGFIHTHWAHHYVAAGKKSTVTYVTAGMKLGPSANCWLRHFNPLSAVPVDLSLAVIYRVQLDTASRTHPLDPPLVVDGPARIDLMIGPDSTTAGTIFGGFGFYDITT